jgi:hypothetical protein
MQSIYLNGWPGGSQEFKALVIEPFYETEETNYTRIDWNNVRLIHAKYKGWRVSFTYLTEAEMDLLEELVMYDASFSLDDSTYYDVIIRSLKATVTGGSIVVIKKEHE